MKDSILDYLTPEEETKLRASMSEEEFRETFYPYESFDKDYGCIEGEILSNDFIIDGR